MCGGGGGDTNAAANAAAEARASEERRQARYQEGLDNINRLYDYGETRAPGSENPAWVAWNERRQSGAGGMWGAGVEPPRYLTGSGWVRTSRPYDQAFYDERSQVYRDFALPQVEEQASRTHRELEYWLARQGLTRSSVAGEKQRDFELEDGRARQGVEQQAQDYGAQARADVAAARQAAVSALQATNDPSAALTIARDRIGTINTPPAFSPIGSLFSNTLATIGATGAYMRDQSGGYRPGDGVRYYGASGGGSVRNVGGG